MKKQCRLCGKSFKQDELVELTVIAPWVDIPSKVSFSVGKPLDTYPDTLVHHSCMENQ